MSEVVATDDVWVTWSCHMSLAWCFFNFIKDSRGSSCVAISCAKKVVDLLAEVLDDGALRRGEVAAELAHERARLAPAEVHEVDQHDEEDTQAARAARGTDRGKPLRRSRGVAPAAMALRIRVSSGSGLQTGIERRSLGAEETSPKPTWMCRFSDATRPIPSSDRRGPCFSSSPNSPRVSPRAPNLLATL